LGQVVTNQGHDAAASALGYLYQCQWPLVELVTRSRYQPDCEVLLELLDDVSWEVDGSPVELIQTKHHLEARASLSDMSPDVWRTIASWMDTHPPGDIAGPTLTLVTTDIAAVGTAASALSGPQPDWRVALRLLEAAAADSASVETAAARSRFLALDTSARAVFVGRMRVMDGSATIADLPDALRRELHLVLPVGHEETFIELVWGWWHQCVVHLLQRAKHSVSGLELRAFIDDLRDKFTSDNLPTLVNRSDFDLETVADYENSPFVHQLAWIEAPPAVLQMAIQNYFRAVTQSARWIEENLVGFDEVERFEADLKDEWSRIFAWIEQHLPPDADDSAKIEAGREVLRRAEDMVWIRIRERYSEPFFFRGKLHQLADDSSIGWHPEFRQKLDDLLLGSQP